MFLLLLLASNLLPSCHRTFLSCLRCQLDYVLEDWWPLHQGLIPRVSHAAPYYRFMLLHFHLARLLSSAVDQWSTIPLSATARWTCVPVMTLWSDVVSVNLTLVP